MVSISDSTFSRETGCAGGICQESLLEQTKSVYRGAHHKDLISEGPYLFHTFPLTQNFVEFATFRHKGNTVLLHSTLEIAVDFESSGKEYILGLALQL